MTYEKTQRRIRLYGIDCPENYNLDILAHLTGTKRGRLQRLTKLGIERVETYELALIEMAADKEA